MNIVRFSLIAMLTTTVSQPCHAQAAKASGQDNFGYVISAETPSPSNAATAGAVQYNTTGGAADPNAPDPVKTCMAYLSTEAPPPRKKKNGPVRLVAKALASELKTDGSDMLKDTMFVFSAKDFDPYDKQAPKDKPYTLLEIQLVDGEQASLIKYPDNSGKIVGSYADGTIIAPAGRDTFIVAYPNGARGKMVKVNGIEYKIYRPDNTVTTIKKSMDGGYEISNSKTGFMGEANPDREGMQFEFGTKDF